jgi:RNA 2',3'-cyclic 3'-phosphodiesterase
MENEKKRLFIAISLPPESRKFLYDVAANLQKIDRDLRIIPEDNIHVTLKFLGDTSTSKINNIASGMKDSIKDFKNFSFGIGGLLGAFPAAKSARILFASLTGDNENIIGIYKNLEDDLAKIKIPRDSRGFTSHITIARIKYQKNITELINNTKLEYKKLITCTGITLFESILKSGGSEYVVIDKFELK